jgi:hypothetical protein
MCCAVIRPSVSLRRPSLVIALWIQSSRTSSECTRSRLTRRRATSCKYSTCCNSHPQLLVIQVIPVAWRAEIAAVCFCYSVKDQNWSQGVARYNNALQHCSKFYDLSPEQMEDLKAAKLSLYNNVSARFG